MSDVSCNSENDNSGCFSGILRRLLCTGSVPTHPSDQIFESNNTTKPTHPQKIPKPEAQIQASSASFSASASASASASPGIVARLMGLDSLPETNWVSKGRSPDLVTRSRSVSFADYLLGFDLTQAQANDHHLHRRVRTSVSFREDPAVLNQIHQPSHDFLVVYLDNVDGKSKELGSKVRKSEVGVGQLKQLKKEQRIKNKESKRETDEVMKTKKEKVVKKQNKKIMVSSKLKDEPRRVCGGQSSSKVPHKKSSVGYKNGGGANLKEDHSDHDHHPVKKTKQQQKKKKLVVEPTMKKKNHQHAAKKTEVADHFHGSENTSPVSVLDIDDILVQHECWLSEYSSPMDLNSKTRSLPKAAYNDDPEMRAAKRTDCEPINNEDTRDYAEELAAKIQRLTEEDVKESSWVPKNVVEFEGFEEICVKFEGLILHELLHQTIDELMQLSYEDHLCTFKA